ncbi:MAG: tetratricopeptide repeat protein [Candidatus Hermodarchaeota archaeon]
MSQSSFPTEFQYVLSNLSTSSLELIKQTYNKLSPDFQTEFEAYSHALSEIMKNNAAKENVIQYLAVKVWFICGHLDWILDIGSRLSHPGAKSYYALALLFKGDSKQAIDILECLRSRDPYFRMEILGLLSFCYSVTRKYKKVEKIFKEIKQIQSLPFFKNNPLIAQEGYVWGLTRYAYTIRAMGDLERALEMIEQAQQFSLELNSRHLQILALLIFGQCLENRAIFICF